MENGVVDDSPLLTTHSVKEVLEHEVTSSEIVESEADAVFEDSISTETPRVTHSDDLNNLNNTVDVEFNLDSEIEVETFKSENHKDEVQQVVVAEDKIEDATAEDKPIPIVEETAPDASEGETTANLDSEVEVENFKDAIEVFSATENHKDEIQQVLAEDEIEAVVANQEAIVEATALDVHQEEIEEVIIPEEHQNGVYEREVEAVGVSSGTENHKDEVQQVVADDMIEDVAADNEPIVEATSPDTHQAETSAKEEIVEVVMPQEHQNGVYESEKEAIEISSANENHKDEVQKVVADERIEDVTTDKEPIVEATAPDTHQAETSAKEEIGEAVMPEEHQNGVYESEKVATEISSAIENHKDEVLFVAEDKIENVALDEQPIIEATAPDALQGETTANKEIEEVTMPEEHQNGTYGREKDAIGISSATENHKDEVQVVAEEKIKSVAADDEEGQFVAEDKIEVVADNQPIIEATVPDAHQGETTANEEHQNGVYEKEAIGISSESQNHKDEIQFVAEDKIEFVVVEDHPIIEATASDGEEEQNGAFEREKLSDSQINNNNNANEDVDIITKELKIDSRPKTSGAPSVAEVDCESSHEPIHNLSTDNLKMEPNFEEKEEKVVEPMEEAEIKPTVAIPPSSQKSTTAHPAGLGRAAPLSESAPRAVHHPRVNGALSQTQNQSVDETLNNGVGEPTEEYDETREKLQMIRVKFLRLALRLGQTPHNAVVAQVLYRLGLAEQLRGRSGGRVAAFSFDRASAMAEQLEAGGQEPLDFSCTIMVLGKTGVGKSATINSIFDEIKFGTDAFQLGTKKVEDVVGTVQGIKVRVIDTPGLLPSWTDQQHNVKILRSVKQFMKKTPPDIVLYLDRLDMQSRDLTDLPLLRTITEIFGPSIWFNAIVVLTHAASAPPEGPNGTTTSYDMFVTQRSHAVQQAIRMAAGDMRLMNPVSLVENHSACRTNRSGQRVLPNGQVWKPHLLLLSFASKILTEANALLKLQDGPPGRPFTTRTRSPPLPYLLSSLLQSRPHLKLPEEQFGGDDDDIEEDSSESDNESEFDELPPFKPLARAELAKLAKAQKKAYYDEIEYREKLFMKKQLKEEKMRRKMMKKMAASKDLPVEEEESEEGAAASVPVAMPDLALPASFDADYPSHRYRCLDSPNQWVVRPVLDTQGWDHDVGYEGVNVERLFVVKKKIPVSLSGQLTKDKKDSTLQMELSSSLKHGEGKATSLGFDMQTLGKDMAYTLRGETRLSNRRRNKFSTGVSATLLGDSVTAGLKLEDKLIVNKRFRMVLSGGAMAGQSDVAYGGSLEATLRDKDHPLGRFLSTLGLSVMDWHGDLAIGGNLQSQIPIGRYTNLIARGNLNNRGSGNVSIRLNSSEQIQIALIAVIPLISKLVGYPQQLHYGQ
ncbi:translocase of chloroplast 120, chloroplastic-like [Impatiens glandulifera]|uniref:translocase of chloroplast 120, chloroplastic-like n=1 Tax=Impatiens glandulifera TaxID=253017 RepID=UPI001FB12155|nr:translocase of chloroplast 120, chloroplastic-like [Impatiens glandulifera]